jgi:retinoid hydroxylase
MCTARHNRSRLQPWRDQILRRLVALRRKQRDEPARDVLGLIVRARDDDGRPLTDAQIVAHINILLVAGYETTTVLSAWMLYLLATQHTERERVEGELAALLGDAAQPVTIEALRAMRQLDLFIKEAARLYSPLIALPRGVVQPVEWNGYTLPVGTRVRLALAAGHRLPHVFADPERFDPQRFAPPREEERRTPYGFVPFGGGARLCIGINFATLELKVIAALVLRYYHLAAAPDQQPTHAGHVTATIPQGIRLRVARK